jgi:hypothetical protein
MPSQCDICLMPYHVSSQAYHLDPDSIGAMRRVAALCLALVSLVCADGFINHSLFTAKSLS